MRFLDMLKILKNHDKFKPRERKCHVFSGINIGIFN